MSWSTRFLELKIIGSNVESLRVGGNKECEDTDPPLSFFKTFFESGVGYVRGLWCCLHHLAAGSPCPGFCTDMKGAINEIHARGGTGVGPPLVYLAVHGHASGTWINE